MKQRPEFMMLSGTATAPSEDAEREELVSIVSRLPIEKVRELLASLEERR